MLISFFTFINNSHAQCVNQMVCNDNGCNYVDVCDSANDQQSVFEDLTPYSPPAYGSPGYSAYDAAPQCFDKLVNGLLVKVCR